MPSSVLVAVGVELHRAHENRIKENVKRGECGDIEREQLQGSASYIISCMCVSVSVCNACDCLCLLASPHVCVCV